MSIGINQRYFLWLYGSMEKGAPLNRSYRKLAYILFMKEFTWTVPNDGNRIEDGKNLRGIFREEFRVDSQDESPCSVLEVLISMARRMEDILYEPDEPDRTSKWFWMLIDNLGLKTFTDESYFANRRSFERAVDKVLETFIDRTYDRKGDGGLFPLKKPRKDQRDVELWYQMMEFLDENFRY